jgi:hypothetical protein
MHIGGAPAVNRENIPLFLGYSRVSLAKIMRHVWRAHRGRARRIGRTRVCAIVVTASTIGYGPWAVVASTNKAWCA